MPTPCVASVPIFAELDSDEHLAIAQRLEHRSLGDGEVVEFPGDAPALRVVHHGRVRQSRVMQSGNEQLLRVLAPGDFTGESAVLSGRPAQQLSVAMGKTEVCELSAEHMREVLEDHSSVARHMLQTLSRRLSAAESQLAHITGQSVGERLAQYLAALASRVPAGASFTLPMTKKDLASFLGTTPETISRRLRALEEAQMIQQGPRGQMTVVDPVALVSGT